jgi:hypothetical protein
MLINICFGFMIFSSSLIESLIAKTRMWQKRNTQLANFDQPTLRVICLIVTPCDADRILRDQTARQAMPDPKIQAASPRRIPYGICSICWEVATAVVSLVHWWRRGGAERLPC